MVSPAELATLIALCVPWGEPQLVAALVEGGSGREPYLLSSSTGVLASPRTSREAAQQLADLSSGTTGSAQESDVFIGLAQIPLTSLRKSKLDPALALNKCTNLEIGYHLLLDAYQIAAKTERSPWKRTSLAYNYYREQRPVQETAYSKRVADYLTKVATARPAKMTDPIYHAALAEWSAGLAARQSRQTLESGQPALISSQALASRSRIGM